MGVKGTDVGVGSEGNVGVGSCAVASCVGSRISGEKVDVGDGNGAAVGLLQADIPNKRKTITITRIDFFIFTPYEDAGTQ
jgi:hypothetical protein